MPFNCIPVKDFFHRRDEVLALKRLADLRENHLTGNILLAGARGVGKTELLKQLYRTVYWEDANVIPFYYSFKTATLKASVFARDYFNQFIRQYLSYCSKDPSLVNSRGSSLAREIPASSSWLFDLVDAFEELCTSGDFYGQFLAAISAPAHIAARSGKPVLILLDNFQMTTRLYEEKPGDFSGLVSFFESSMKTNSCPHILSGSPAETLESVFAESALRGTVERMVLNPLPDDGAYALFKSFCDRLGVREDQETSRTFGRFLGCNPFYIKCMAHAFSRMRKKEASLRDLWECYSHELLDGEIALYWTSLLSEALPDPLARRLAVRIFMHSVETGGDVAAVGRLPRILGAPESAVKEVLAGLRAGGFLQGALGYKTPKDNVLLDFMQCLSLLEIEGRHPERVREFITAKYADSANAGDCYEVVLPAAPEAELIAAKTLEQIAKNLHLPPDVAERLQLALIEACINAMEHSGGLEKKVFVRFLVTGTRLEIAVESSGRFFDPEAVEDPSIEVKLTSAHKRGWGLKLIQSIMDEVRIERIDDRTRVLLIKHIKHNEVVHDTSGL